jgi:hypothetical protein
MKKSSFTVLGLVLILALTGCSLPLAGRTSPTPTQIILPSPVQPLATSTPAVPTPAVPTPTLNVPTITPGVPVPALSSPTPLTAGTQGAPSGPYGVILVAAGDTLNIRSGPGASYPVSGSFPPTATNVMRSGPSSTAGSDLWVQVQNLGGGSGWVNANYLTEYVAPSTFCADGRVNLLLTGFANALKTANGATLATQVSPAHGMAVRLWRYADPIVFDREHARWVFESTYAHNWGAAPGSGMESIGSFHEVVLPTWLDVVNGMYTLNCNSVQTGGASYNTAWPALYTNVNFYTLYKPGPAGNELSWRTLFIGVEYVLGQPYIFSVTQMNWEP